MQKTIKKIVIIGLQQTFLQMVFDQITELTRKKIETRTVSLNDLAKNPLTPDETILYFSKGLKAIVDKMFPECGQYIYARRESLIYNMRDLFTLNHGNRILVVNDVKNNTDAMTKELQNLGLDHKFFPYYPDEPLPKDINLVITAGERMLVPTNLKGKPIIDIGLRFISLETVYALFDHFNIPYTHADLARHYMRTMMMLSEKWPVLGKYKYRHSNWFGIRQDTLAQFSFDDFIQKSDAMTLFCRGAKKMAITGKPIHIYGRTGTGKTKISQAIHNASRFKEGPFISINCAARTAQTLERELFGWEDARVTHPSLFESAENGTLCIEEVGKLPEELYAGLKQAISEKKIIRANGNGVVAINTRLITTSSFRLDKTHPHIFDPTLLFMITQHVCRIPTLNERMDDFDTLVADYIGTNLKKPQLLIPEETLTALKSYSWEGNIQELYNVLQHTVCMSTDILSRKYLPYYITKNTIGVKQSNDQQIKLKSALEKEFLSITQDLTTHGFLAETRQILKIYMAGKVQHQAYGRSKVQNRLQESGFKLTRQQLRLKLERMDKLGLLIVRPGRGGTTISEKGEGYLKTLPVKIL